MPNEEDVNEANQEPPFFKHKTRKISLMSYLLAEGGWAPKAQINCCVGGDHLGQQQVVDAADHPLPTKEAADTVAKKLAIEWIDAQFPSATN
jgi:hypothetical protein